MKGRVNNQFRCFDAKICPEEKLRRDENVMVVSLAHWLLFFLLQISFLISWDFVSMVLLRHRSSFVRLGLGC